MPRAQSEDALSEDHSKLADELLSDLEQVEKELGRNGHQTWRRAWCRALFAFIEGDLAYAKRLRLLTDYWILDESAELGLQDTKLITTRNGGSRHVKAYMPLKDAIRATIDAFAAHSGAQPPVPHDDPGWAKLADCITIRNRVVHPKTFTDLMISDDEMRLLHGVALWYLDAMTLAQQLYASAQLRRLRARLKRAKQYYRRQPPDQDMPAK
jgi:hypothetical protein